MSQISKYRFFAILLAILIFFTGLCTTSFTSAAHSDNSSLQLSCLSKTMEIGDQMYLSAYAPAGGSPTFKSSNPSVASVTRSGKITAKASGNAKISATINGVSAVCTVKVKKPTIDICASGIKIEKKGSYRLRASASNYAPIKWKSLNPSIASVSPSGIVTGKRPGTATIVAYTQNAKASCQVTVKVPKLRLNKTSLCLKPGDHTRIVATSSASLIPVWTSSNPNIVTVNSTGNITAIKKGTAIIRASVDGVHAQCTVTVK